MKITRLRLTVAPDDRIDVWAPDDLEHRRVKIGTVEIDLPIECIESLHAALATTLDLRCRPRTLYEMHTSRESLGLSP